MRDVGRMGESAFSMWCASAGLIANSSQVDKTGWDFIVEFPFISDLSPMELHKSAHTCMVQVKSTDKQERKLQITLSNLRRLATAQMPTFFAFIEFDKKESAQRVFIVHVDNELSLQILRRLHEIEQDCSSESLNKKKKTISYGNENLLDEINGESLKQTLLQYIGNDYSLYVKNKSMFLETSGFEDGAYNLTFTTVGEENTKKFINMTLGIEEHVEVTSVLGTLTRFGVQAKKPFLDFQTCQLHLPEVKPTFKGTLRIKENKLSSGFSFKANLYISPLHFYTEESLRNSRIETSCFDFLFNMHTGVASYRSTVSGNSRVDARDFYNALGVLKAMGERKSLYFEFINENKKILKFKTNEKDNNLDYEIYSLMGNVLSLSTIFDIHESINISPNELLDSKIEIERIYKVITLPPSQLRVDFSYIGHDKPASNEFACIFFLSARIGSYGVGCIVTVIGPAIIDSVGNYSVSGRKRVIDEKIVLSEDDETIEEGYLMDALNKLREKYENRYTVITMGDVVQE
ncbi:hypothetical protein ACK37F_14060 [Aeromonas veronii]